MKNVTDTSPRLYVELEGPLVSETDMGNVVWTHRAFSSLNRISRSGVCSIFLVAERGDQEGLLRYVAETLRGQEVAVEEVIFCTDMVHWKTESRSWYVGERPQEYATQLGAEPIRFSTWPAVEEQLVGPREEPMREASIRRKTRETDIELTLNLDGTGKGSISTGLPFLDHMLDQVARHARFDIDLACSGDLEVDEHHTVEDVALVLGQATATALADKRGISRYGFSLLPMDDCLAEVALDFSGRPWFVWNVEFSRDLVGTFPTELFSHFFKSFSDEAKCNLHMTVSEGNVHHQAEALFKAFARALRSAVFRFPGSNDLPSTKGVL